jgi:YihY family inner membrane protein
MLNRVRERLDRAVRGHAWVAFPYAVVKKFGEDRAGQQAALVAYYGFFSLFPLLLFATTMLGIVLHGHPALQQRVLESALSQFPIIGDEIRSNVSALPRSGAALVVGLAGALWGGLAGIKAVHGAMDVVWDVPVRRRPSLPQQLKRGSAMLVVLATFVGVATAVSGFGVSATSVSIPMRIGAFAASLAVDVVVFLLAFKILTTADIGWRDVVPGSIIAGVAWGGLQTVGTYFVGNQLRTASATYGLFGLVIGLMSWLYLGAQITLLAAEVNVVRARRLWPRSLGTEPATDADRRALEALAKTEERAPSEEVDVRFDGDGR